MKAEGDKVTLVDYGGSKQARFEYYTYRGGMRNYNELFDWANNTLGNYGKDWYYSYTKYWFKSEEDLLAFTIRFPE